MITFGCFWHFWLQPFNFIFIYVLINYLFLNSLHLQALKPRLLAAGFQWRSLTGDMSLSARTAALLEFQTDPPTTIFLLSIRAGACGINLTEANQVDRLYRDRMKWEEGGIYF